MPSLPLGHLSHGREDIRAEMAGDVVFGFGMGSINPALKDRAVLGGPVGAAADMGNLPGRARGEFGPTHGPAGAC